MTIRLCFVCLGNICRSPTAEAAMRRLLHEEGLTERVEIDSAGTGAWHVGEAPDGRSRAAGKRRGLDVRGKARAFEQEDFAKFDYVLAMDRSNQTALLELADEVDAQARVWLFRQFDPDAPPDAEVPDPYYGGPQGFDRVIDICEAACRGLLEHLKGRHAL